MGTKHVWMYTSLHAEKQILMQKDRNLTGRTVKKENISVNIIFKCACVSLPNKLNHNKIKVMQHNILMQREKNLTGCKKIKNMCF